MPCPRARTRHDRVGCVRAPTPATLPKMNSAKSRRAQRGGSARIEGAKRNEILAAATERFGRDGYEDTKWADIAADVGVGPTALYHYFESKQHCLFVILGQAMTDFHARFAHLAG